ncbi:MAG: hypothetical protein LRS41_01095 [Caldisphaeraceae archaeon]|nr:hypothetical protein [Caldisphaeraceae archaeon]
MFIVNSPVNNPSVSFGEEDKCLSCLDLSSPPFPLEKDARFILTILI